MYHRTAQLHVDLSFTAVLYTGDVNALGTLRLLEATVPLKLSDKIKFYNISDLGPFKCIVYVEMTRGIRLAVPKCLAKAWKLPRLKPLHFVLD